MSSTYKIILRIKELNYEALKKRLILMKSLEFYNKSVFAKDARKLSASDLQSFESKDLSNYLNITLKSAKTAVCHSVKFSSREITLMFDDYELEDITKEKYSDIIAMLKMLSDYFEISDLEMIYGNDEMIVPWIIFMPKEKCGGDNLKKIRKFEVYDVIDINNGKLIVMNREIYFDTRPGSAAEKVLAIAKGFDRKEYAMYVWRGDRQKAEKWLKNILETK